jgi:hypothetical protein
LGKFINKVLLTDRVDSEYVWARPNYVCGWLVS